MISRKEIENLAELSRLKLEDAELSALQKEFGAILDYVGQIKSAESATAEISQVHNVMREDSNDATVGGTPESLLNSAPKTEGGYIVVRKIIARDEPEL